MTPQQSETLNYFNSIAENWLEKSNSTKGFNIVKARNNFVIDILNKIPEIKSLLDLGCGTGNLCELASHKLKHVTGVDFAPQMIKIAEEKKKQNKLNIHYFCESIFQFDSKQRYDCIVANGLIEYFSPEETEKIFQKVNRSLNPTGYFIFASRNRLYNAFSQNDFTFRELKKGYLKSLIEEAYYLGQCKSPNQIQRIPSLPFMGIDYPQANTGIGVEKRHQYTPGQLAKCLSEYGFQVRGIAPVHRQLFQEDEKNNIETLAKWSLSTRGASEERMNFNEIPFSSSFMLLAEKHEVSQ